MFESERKRAVIERCLIVMLGCCILAYLGMCAIINFRGFERYCDSDMYADTLVSRLMWEQKTFFPKNWIFSNQFYFIATPVLSALFYGLTGNSNTAMALATSVMTGLIFVSFLWLLQAITKDFLVQLFACFLFISSVIAPDGPSSLNAQLFFVMASYYACYLIAMFVVFGDYIRATKSTLPRLGTWILCLFLSFTTGMQSLRQTVVMVLPILAYEFFLAIRRMLQGDKPWNKGNIRTLIRAASYAVANVAGVITIELINPPHTSIYGDMALTPLKMLPQQIPPFGWHFRKLQI